MPITNCKIHGESACVEMCKHLHKKLKKGIYQTYFQLPIKTTRLCAKCFEKYNVQEILDAGQFDAKEIDSFWGKQHGEEATHFRFYGTKINALTENYPDMRERLDFIYDAIAKKRGWECTSCIDQIRIDFARRNKIDLPFSPVENTLMRYEDKRVKKLEKKLEKHLNPKGLSVTKRPKDWDLEFGSLRKLFTITVYGVTKKKQQDRVVKIIEKFFKKIPEKQRSVVFHGQREWVTDKNGATFAKTPKMIAEITVMK